MPLEAGWSLTATAAHDGDLPIFDSPDAAAPARTLANPRLINNDPNAAVPLLFLVKDTPDTNCDWVEVYLPVRPNGSTGFVPADSVTVAKTPFRIFVDLKDRTLRVEKDGTGVFTAEVAVGTKENPTPTNGTYVTELIQNTKPNGSYGPYAFGLALHSNTLTEFNGGPGQVGIHGTDQPQKIGQAVSHGCIRLRNSDITDLKDLGLPLGVPVFIT